MHNFYITIDDNFPFIKQTRDDLKLVYISYPFFQDFNDVDINKLKQHEQNIVNIIKKHNLILDFDETKEIRIIENIAKFVCDDTPQKMSDSLYLLSFADLVVLPNYMTSSSRTCRIEKTFCDEYKIPYVSYDYNSYKMISILNAEVNFYA